MIITAQNFSFTGRLGFANYQGELKAKAISLSQANLMGTISARYDLSEHFTARSYLTLTSLQADDKRGTTSMQRRNLNFQTKIVDWELTGSIVFLVLMIAGGRLIYLPV